MEIQVIRLEMLRFPLLQKSRSLLPFRHRLWGRLWGRLPASLRSFALGLRGKSRRLMVSRDWVGQLAFVSCTWGCARHMFMTGALGVNRALRDVLIYG